jgi:cell division protein YceG involved in septum cleavage
MVNEGDSLGKVFEQVSTGLDTLKLKRFLRNNPEVISSLQPGSYIFSGEYSFDEFFSLLDGGPQVSYASVTLLE